MDTQTGRSMELQASLEDVQRLVRGDAEMVAAVMALKPTLAEVEGAIAWNEGDGDLLAKRGRPLSGKVAAIYDILAAERLKPGTGPEGP